MMRFAKHILIGFGVLLAACGGSAEITLENESPAESIAPAAEAEEEVSEDETSGEVESEQPADADETPTENEPEESPVDDSPAVEVTTEEAAAAAEANMSLLAGGDTVFDYDVLNVHTGGISSVGEVVDGDRSVLLWFFSPH